MKIISISVLLFFINCGKSEKINEPNSFRQQSKNENSQINTLPSKIVSLKYILEKGLVCLTEKTEQSETVIKIFNEDGSVWKKIDFASQLVNDNEFKPFAYHPDYYLLVLQCTGEKGNYWEVIVNEETKYKKYINKKSSLLHYETWNQHLLKVFSIGFNSTSNPLQESPSNKSSKILLTKSIYGGFRFEPVLVKGEWLKIKWQKDDETWSYGWVKWKDENKLLLELFYFA